MSPAEERQWPELDDSRDGEEQTRGDKDVDSIGICHQLDVEKELPEVKNS